MKMANNYADNYVGCLSKEKKTKSYGNSSYYFNNNNNQGLDSQVLGYNNIITDLTIKSWYFVICFRLVR